MLLIKKTIDLSSLGSEYAGIVLEFKSIPALEVSRLSEKETELKKNKQSIIPFFVDVTQNQFISGKQNEAVLNKDDLKELDADALGFIVGILTGGAGDPKASSESMNTSSTTPEEV